MTWVVSSLPTPDRRAERALLWASEIRCPPWNQWTGTTRRDPIIIFFTKLKPNQIFFVYKGFNYHKSCWDLITTQKKKKSYNSSEGSAVKLVSPVSTGLASSISSSAGIQKMSRAAVNEPLLHITGPAQEYTSGDITCLLLYTFTTREAVRRAEGV